MLKTNPAHLLAILTGSAVFAASEPSQSPLTPENERGTFRFADANLIIELVAAEPEVVSPVAIAWDANGRMFVAEMMDYPNASSGGRIRLLEDRDGDGRYERATVFAEKLPYPNGVLPWNGGVLVTAAPDILFFKDTDGDGRADERRILLTGFGQGNQQLRVNGLFWGLDNWVYGANGRSDGEIRRSDAPSGKTVSLRGHDFRFRPDTGEFEAIAGRSQFGSARDDWGNRFLSWNTIPARHEVLPEHYLNRNPNLATTESVLDIISPGDDGRVFPLTPPPLVFNNESSSHFNALAGLTIYRGAALGEKYRGNAFVGESLRNLVHRRVLVPNGVTFVAKRGEEGKEFLASTDPWFHPVNFATGPDGALYVVDFYRRFVEHPGFVPGNLREQIQWRTGAEHGRIWRIRIKYPKTQPPTTQLKLSRASSVELVKCLENQNGWWRDTAQRLLVERQDQKVIPALKKLARKGQLPESRLQALWTLDGIRSNDHSALDDDTLHPALEDKKEEVRVNALKLCESRLGTSLPSPKVSAAVERMVKDPSPKVRFQLALTLGELKAPERSDLLLAQLAGEGIKDKWQSLAIQSSIRNQNGLFLKTLARQNPGWFNEPTPEQRKFLEQVAIQIGARNNDTELVVSLPVLLGGVPGPTRLEVAAGLAEGLARANRSLRDWMNRPSAILGEPSQAFTRWIAQAQATATNQVELLPYRVAAIRLLKQTKSESARSVLLGLLQTEHPPEVQSAAAGALMDFGDRELAAKIFAGWSQYTTSIRRQMLSSALRSPTATAALVDALEARKVLPDELDASTRQALRNVQNPDLAKRVKRIVQTDTAPSRDEVVRSFEPSLKMAGDRQRGATTFAKLCLLCHAIQGKGNHVGPDLSGVASRPKEALLVDILDPSRQVTPDFISYTLTTTQGETVMGLIAAESANGVTVRRAGQPDETISRTQIAGLRAEGKSLMPDGLEQGLTQQDLADLLDFLQKPDNKLLPEEK
ncbi:MAG: HEAT repeat domain-containing protein [Verrucomicrobia bacterium]|nr:HEAT repeat domain-containing protein [Verrucomicrobiota bacterium]